MKYVMREDAQFQDGRHPQVINAAEVVAIEGRTVKFSEPDSFFGRDYFLVPGNHDLLLNVGDFHYVHEDGPCAGMQMFLKREEFFANYRERK